MTDLKDGRGTRPLSHGRGRESLSGFDGSKAGKVLAFCFDAFSSREPVSTSLENALCALKITVDSTATLLQHDGNKAGQAVVIADG